MEIKLTRSELLWLIRAIEVAVAKTKVDGNETLVLTFSNLQQKFEQLALSGPTIFELKQA